MKTFIFLIQVLYVCVFLLFIFNNHNKVYSSTVKYFFVKVLMRCVCACVPVFGAVWCVCVALTCMRLTEQPGGARPHHPVLGGVEDRLRQRDRVTHHRPVEAVLRHDAAAAPALLPLPPLRPPVLEPDLHRHRKWPVNSRSINSWST